MKKHYIGWMGIVVMAASVAGAGTLDGMQAWAEQAGRGSVSNALFLWGVTNATETGAILERWDEAEVIERALETSAWDLLDAVRKRDGFSDAGLDRIRKALEKEPELPTPALALIRLLPVPDRAPFADRLPALGAKVYASTPVRGKLEIKHVVLGGRSLFAKTTPLPDMVELLLAPEPMRDFDLRRAKAAIKATAIDLARADLRARGESFVLREDGRNPLEEAIRPVVDALNAPGARGLEAALRAIGADLPDFDREELELATARWREQALAGELSGGPLTLVLGKLIAGLGVDGFNAFVERYNHGTGETDQ